MKHYTLKKLKSDGTYFFHNPPLDAMTHEEALTMRKKLINPSAWSLHELVTWFAVLVELEGPEFCTFGQCFRPRKSGEITHYRVDIEVKDRSYSVAFCGGSALRALAEKKAEVEGGFVVEVFGNYALNKSDIDPARIAKAA